MIPTSGKAIVELKGIGIVEDDGEVEVGETRVAFAGGKSVAEINRAHTMDAAELSTNDAFHRVIDAGVDVAKRAVPARTNQVVLCVLDNFALHARRNQGAHYFTITSMTVAATGCGRETVLPVASSILINRDIAHPSLFACASCACVQSAISLPSFQIGAGSLQFVPDMKSSTLPEVTGRCGETLLFKCREVGFDDSGLRARGLSDDVG